MAFNRAVILLSLLCVAAASPEPATRWSLEAKSDAMTDAKSVQLVGQAGDNLLIVMCRSSDKNNPNVGAATPDFLGTYPVARQTMIRFDKQPAISSTWGYSQHHAFDTEASIGFMANMATASSVTIRLKKYDGGYVDLTFPLQGAGLQLKKFNEACQRAGIVW